MMIWFIISVRENIFFKLKAFGKSEKFVNNDIHEREFKYHLCERYQISCHRLLSIMIQKE